MDTLDTLLRLAVLVNTSTLDEALQGGFVLVRWFRIVRSRCTVTAASGGMQLKYVLKIIGKIYFTIDGRQSDTKEDILLDLISFIT